MRLARRAFSYINDVKLETRGIVVEWADGQQSPLSNWLLRDLDSLLPKTEFNPELRMKSVTLKDSSNSLVINWSDEQQSVLSVDKLHSLITGTYYALPRAEKSDSFNIRRVNWGSLELTAEVAAFVEELCKKGAVIVKHDKLDEVMQRAFGSYKPAEILPKPSPATHGAHLSNPPMFLGITTRSVNLVDSFMLTDILPAETKEFFSKLPIAYCKGNYFAAQYTLRGNRIVFDPHSRAAHCYPAAFYKHWSMLTSAVSAIPITVDLAKGESILLDNSRFLHSTEASEAAYEVSQDDALARVRELLNPLK
mmetsp:Transcript_13242/g.24813  ORF Transcript_13242/g.24813 Transcript_13242/m.24813 type:complete len:308 (+) Transcript_13242:1072-1995(+)